MRSMILLPLLLLVVSVAACDEGLSSASSELGDAPMVHGVTAPAIASSADSPATTITGDWVVSIAWSQGIIPPVHTLQAGYTSLQARTLNDGNTDGKLSVAYRVAAADGAVAQTPWVITDATAGQTSFAVIALSNVDIALSSGTSGTSSSAPNPPTVGQGAMWDDWTILGIGGWQMTQSKPTVAGVLPTESGGDSTYSMLTQNGPANHVTHLGVMTREYTDLTGATIDPPPFTDNQTPNGTASITIGFRGLAP